MIEFLKRFFLIIIDVFFGFLFVLVSSAIIILALIFEKPFRISYKNKELFSYRGRVR